MTQLHLKLFGRFQITGNGATLTPLLRSRARRLLAYLLLHRHTAQPRENVAFTLWPDTPEKQALDTLRRALSELRATLPEGEWFLASRGELHWNSEAPYRLDLEQFEGLLHQATPAALHEAVNLYEADLLAEWDDDWLLARREYLRQRQCNALRQLTAHHRGLGDYETALNCARQALALDPFAEAIYRDLMALAYEAGDRAAALAEYDRLQTLLRAELGVDPMAETQALREAIVQGISLLAPEPSAARSALAGSTPQTLPRPIGREAEMAQLAGLWAETEAGQGRFALISGEAGVGKSHLAFSLVDYTAGRGGLALVGHCYEFERALPYQAVVEMLRAAAKLLPHTNLPAVHRSALAGLVPDVLGLAGSPAPELQLSPDDLRAQLFEAILQAFLALARSQPLLLLFEDVHWAAESTLDWLAYIAPRLSASCILVVITYRTNEVAADHGLARLRRRFAREGAVFPVSLKPLSRAANRQLVAHLSGLAEPAAASLADRLFDETAGNPFFLQEIVRGLIEAGQIVVGEGGWRGAFVELAPGVVVPLPESLRETIKARLERLREMARMFIRLAAVAGRVFDYELVRHAGAWSEELALGALEEVLARGFIRPDQVGFAFTHHLVQEVIYADLTGPRRTYLHRRLAEALQRLHPDDFETLAYHFAHAGDDERARTYYLQAGDHAWQLVALKDAADHYQAALARWPEADPAGQAAVLYKLGQCQWVIMEQQSALASFEAARSLFESLGQRIKAGDVDRLIGRMYWELGDVQAAWPHYRRALAILEQGPETVELARAISAISQMHMLASEYDKAIEWGERALAMAGRLQAEEVKVHALNNVGISRMSVDRHDPERGLAMVRESLRRAIALGLPHDACRAYLNMGDGLIGLSRYEEARAIYDELHTYASRGYVRAFIGAALLLRQGLDWLAGRWRIALASRPQIVAVTKGPWRVWASTRFALIENDLGRAEAARLELEKMLPDALQWGEMQTTVPHLGQLVRAYAALGWEPQAAETIRQLLDLIDHNPTLHSECPSALLTACRWYATRPDSLHAAQGCLPRLERARAQTHSPESEAALAEGRGIVALAAGHLPEAAAQFRQAGACWTAINRPYDQARALGSLGSALGAIGERDAARTAFNQALAIFDTLAAELDDPELRQSFLNSALVRETRQNNS